ncbi:TetR/AcrR family transcriptional regulator [Gracilibacillus phocaeensis]|uniref:TetR/AcrR family transcriptional regulator n=1 Tax=Gracilibacillus phocaeensis TaxID=2042304 RepID=UPI003306E8D3
MMEKKIDRRKKYTLMTLKESFISLLNEKPFTAITVKEICEKADINRSTFYTHFADQEDLLYQIEAEIIEEMNKYLQENELVEHRSVQMTEKLLEYIEENKDICYTLLHQQIGTNFEKRIMHIAKDFLMNQTKIPDQEKASYLSTFIISGAIHVIKDWLANDTKQSPEQMAHIIIQFTTNGLSCISNE